MTSSRGVIFVIAIVSLVTIASFSVILHSVTAPFAERKRDADRAFVSLLDLNPRILDNTFGVYIVEFDENSGLADENASRLLQLNELPEKYDLTLVLSTKKISDISIPCLARLTSADLIIVDNSEISDSGITELDTLLANTRVPARAHKASKSGEPIDAIDPRNEAF